MAFRTNPMFPLREDGARCHDGFGSSECKDGARSVWLPKHNDHRRVKSNRFVRGKRGDLHVDGRLKIASVQWKAHPNAAVLG